MFSEDERFEIIKTEGLVGPYARPLIPFRPEYSIRPSYEHLEEIERQFSSRIFMVMGEGSLLAVFMLVSSIMLYRIIRLEQRSARELREFWSRTTHEIKTPITGLKTFLQTIRSHEFKKDELKPLVDLALQQVEKQQQLAQNILVGQRLESNTMSLNMRALVLQEFVRKYVSGHVINLSNRKIELGVFSEEDLIVRGDPEAMHIIMDNLVDNAMKYGGDDLSLSIRVGVEDDLATVTFSDNGPGLNPGMLKNIFEAYRRLTDELPEGNHGTGMGLYLSRKLAREMGGELEAFSEGRGKGASFCLYLRRANT